MTTGGWERVRVLPWPESVESNNSLWADRETRRGQRWGSPGVEVAGQRVPAEALNGGQQGEAGGAVVRARRQANGGGTVAGARRQQGRSKRANGQRQPTAAAVGGSRRQLRKLYGSAAFPGGSFTGRRRPRCRSQARTTTRRETGDGPDGGAWCALRTVCEGYETTRHGVGEASGGDNQVGGTPERLPCVGSSFRQPSPRASLEAGTTAAGAGAGARAAVRGRVRTGKMVKMVRTGVAAPCRAAAG